MLTFFGTSPRSAKFLELATENGLKFDLVVSEPAMAIGRKKILTENPTVTIAKKFNLPFLSNISNVLSPTSHLPLPSPASHFPPPTSRYTLGLILDFHQIIPKNIINHFQKGIINIHFSRLPQYRGPAPVQYTILNGDKNAWITFYLISEKLDEGKILSQISLPLDFSETTDSLYEKLILKAANEAPIIIKKYLEGKPYKIRTVLEKDCPPAPYTKKLTAENCRIDWRKPPQEIDRLIRAAYSEPGAWTSAKIPALPAGRRSKSATIPSKPLRLKILKAHIEGSKLVLDTVQLEGKNPVSWAQFNQGHPEAKII